MVFSALCTSVSDRRLLVQVVVCCTGVNGHLLGQTRDLEPQMIRVRYTGQRNGWRSMSLLCG